MFRLHVTGNEHNHTLSCNRLASLRGQWPLLIASVSGTASQVRAFGAAMHTNNGRYEMRAKDVPAESDWFGCIGKDSFGYKIAYHRMAPNDWQAVVISKRPGLLVSATFDGLWAELTSPRFTTPLLYCWMPYIETQLQEKSLLENLNTAGCKAALLTATTEDLDKIVSRGLALNRIKIERRAA